MYGFIVPMCMGIGVGITFIGLGAIFVWGTHSCQSNRKETLVEFSSQEELNAKRSNKPSQEAA